MIGHPDKALLSLVLLAVGTVVGVLALWRPKWDALASALAGAGVAAWTLTNGPYEGAVLLVAIPGNGLTAADLLSVPALVIVAALVVRALRSRR